MILVILGVCIVMLAIGARFDDGEESVSFAIGVLGLIGTMIALVSAIFITMTVVRANTLDEKIAMYQEENAKIEAQISDVVEGYKEYESETFESVASDSSVVLVSLYPELKSDVLVRSQIEVYIQNNDKIRELKESKIGSSIARWWLYFGK